MYQKCTLTDQQLKRIRCLKDESISVEQKVCVQRARYLTEAYKAYVSEPMIKRRAYAFKNILEKIDLFIEEGQLLAGNQAASLRAASIFPEYCVDWIFEEIDELAQRPGDRFLVDKEVREELLEIAEWWKGKTLEDRCRATLPEEVKNTYELKVLSASGNMTSGDGHIMLDFEKILTVGAQGIIDETKAHLASLDLTVPQNHHKRIFYEAVITAYEGMIDYAHRYAELAAHMAGEETDADRKAELLKISENCRRVPQYPAGTFYEAVQCVWFAHLLSQIESNGHSMSFGRLDQYLYPYYKKDLDEGRLTQGQAEELLACLWVKAFGVVKIRPWEHTRFSGGDPTYQNLTLGGITPEGDDAVNDLTMVCLDSVSLTRLTQPNVSARYHEKNPEEYLMKCAEIIKLGFGMPAMHGDHVMIPSLINRGVDPKDANNYAIVGCIEPIVPGKFGYRSAGMSFTNFAKILEIAMNGGNDLRTGRNLLKQNTTFAEMDSMEELKAAYDRQMEYVVKMRVIGEHCIDYAIEDIVPDAFCSGLVQDCLARGKTAKEGGSIYDMVTGPETGITNAANSLAAVRKLVFEEKRLTPSELLKYLHSNFEGKDGENICRMLLNRAPKFGNDDDYVDEISAEIYLDFMKEQEKYPTARVGRGPVGCLSYPCTATISGNVPQGAPVGATPDGRKAGEPLSEGCSPYHGTDRMGPTAVLNSVAKMPNHLITGGNLLNIRLAPSVMSTEDGQKKVVNMIRTFFMLDGWHVQFNVTSTETLLDAKKHPENYKDLVVRVAGYSALFNDLEEKTKDDIIARTEHEL
ncbi:glycyl radical protein [Anaerostipes sp.]|uniref:glycyl radical protein n=1 Tax=Anaerostipes sp. TaxID=1872530 RepID=UPI0025B94EB0|nr:glycyl radical protein [Anaerostipes sp.]MBS7008812.1 glycyl radical protein [Anaerostipes sp.]